MSHPEQSIVYSAHEYNVEGAALLQQGRHREAIISVSKGLKSILQSLEQDVIHQTSTDICTLLRNHTGTMVNSSVESSKSTLQSTPCLASNCDQDDVFILFNRTLILEETAFVRRWSDDTYGCLMYGVLMYNLGLAMHLGGLTHGDSQRLLEAMRVYFMAYSSLQEFKRLQIDEDNAFGLTLLAIMNNMAHIHVHFRQLTEASQLIDAIRIHLSVYLKPPTKITVDNGDYGTFFLNACFFETNSWPAPAA